MKKKKTKCLVQIFKEGDCFYGLTIRLSEPIKIDSQLGRVMAAEKMVQIVQAIGL